MKIIDTIDLNDRLNELENERFTLEEDGNIDTLSQCRRIKGTTRHEQRSSRMGIW